MREAVLNTGGGSPGPAPTTELLALLQAVQLRGVEEARGEGLHHALHRNLDRLPARVQDKVGLGRWLVGRQQGETLELTRARTRVETLWVTLFI